MQNPIAALLRYRRKGICLRLVKYGQGSFLRYLQLAYRTDEDGHYTYYRTFVITGPMDYIDYRIEEDGGEIASRYQGIPSALFSTAIAELERWRSHSKDVIYLPGRNHITYRCRRTKYSPEEEAMLAKFFG